MEEMEVQILEAKSEQSRLSSSVEKADNPPFNRQYVIGFDVGYQNDLAHACAVVMHLPSRSTVKKENAILQCTFPYVPGYFHLREGPVAIELLSRIRESGPVMIDGNGILHPRRFGLASYIGVKLNIQTIGVAKKLLLGSIGERIGNRAPIIDNEEQIGMAIWMGKRKRPLFVSIGHRISLETAIRVVEEATVFEIPEPIRQAHLCCNEMLRSRTK